ncbi:TetR family transcriptional regulator [Curtobacterium sp. SORGH_AS_0776]|uniref:TetR/AcrR family transcriptional regulator n=1 Tax=Curtobacterium sp. SORGH_AS_0776 TaxID=3041798 RepID=UPI002866E2E0|nr:TetR family transcriptional regulator [Curtobacterium sp. SORGH_AS_0776]MDR6170456.1 AcrR family transcriptional regulator [Curtobacterium sp. SORGH_AS_0776]
MEQREARPKGVRERMRETIRGELTDAAVRLVREVGFDGTTVSAIAAAVGVSERTFFRYFPTKEDAVLQATESLSSAVADALADRPAEESDLEAFRAAFQVAVDSVRAAPDRWATVIGLGRSEPALRRRHLQQQDMWVDALAAAGEERARVGNRATAARLHASVMMLAWERALVSSFHSERFDRIGEELDVAITEVRDFVGR